MSEVAPFYFHFPNLAWPAINLYARQPANGASGCLSATSKISNATATIQYQNTKVIGLLHANQDKYLQCGDGQVLVRT